MLCDGFLYIFDKNLKSGEIVWRCEMRKNSKFYCKATVYTEAHKECQKFVKFRNLHTHEKILGSYEKQKVANKVKNFASESSEKACKIHKKLKNQLGDEVKIAGSEGAVRRKIHRCKKKIKKVS